MIKISKEESQYLKNVNKNIHITIVNKQATKGKKKKRLTQHDNKTLQLIKNYREKHEKIIYEYPPVKE